MSITYSIDGVPLDDANGRWSLLKGTLIGPGFTVRSVDTVIPGMHGSVAGSFEPLDTPSLQLRMKVTGATDVTMLSNLSAITAILTPDADAQIVRTADTTTRFATVRGKSVTEPDYSPTRTAATFTATLRLPGVFWRGASADWSRSSAVSGVSYEVTSLAGSSAAISDARILITGPCAQPKVSNTAGEWCSLSLTLASGEKALVDCGNWVARRGSSVSFTGGGALTSGSINTSGGPYLLRLVPKMRGTDPVNTAVSVALSGSGFTSATSLAVRAAPAYLL